MDFCRNVSVAAGEYHQPEQTHLDDLFSTHTTEVDVSLEWLSIFVEDCLTSTGNCLPPPSTITTTTTITPTTTDPQATNISKSLHLLQKKPQQKARSKRRKKSAKPRSHFMSWTNPTSQNIHHMAMTSPDPLLLQQDHWLADSELIILPQKDEHEHGDGDGDGEGREKGGGQGRRCSHCLSQRTPQWRAGPLGPKTLCNACGVRFKSGRLLPEYRPAKSPTFVTNLHSNSHKKVLEMRNIMPHSG